MSEETTADDPAPRLDPARLGDAVQCPVCKDVMVTPLFFEECGHCLCQLCHLRVDIEAARNSPSFTHPIFRCPECRCGTLLAWHRRKRNICMEHVLEQLEGHEERQRDAAEELDDLLAEHPAMSPIDDGVGNLANIAVRNNVRRTAKFVRDIMPIIYRAAQEGMRKVSITSKARELYMFAREIATTLFGRGVHSVQSNPREFVVHLMVPVAEDWDTSFVNPNYDVDEEL